MDDAKKILIVEDDEVSRELVRMTLERLGYLVTTAEDGVQGYDLAVSAHHDLIITDVNMPAADGAHLVRRVRATPDIERTPILVMTGYGTGNATFTLAQGADAYEPKPINPQSLIDTVKRLLAQETS